MKHLLLILFFCIIGFVSISQEKEPEVVKIIDNLRISWDKEADVLKTYKGLALFCKQSQYRKKIVVMLDKIHHYDTLLYGIVTKKINENNKNKENKKILSDIDKLERKYTTKAFKVFIHEECNTYNAIEQNLGTEKGAEYTTEVKSLTKQLRKYVLEVTRQVDVIDEHVHHLHLGEG